MSGGNGRLKLHHEIFLTAIQRCVKKTCRPVFAYEIADEVRQKRNSVRALLNYLRRGGYVLLIDFTRPKPRCRAQARYILSPEGVSQIGNGEGKCVGCKIRKPILRFQGKNLCNTCLNGDIEQELASLRNEFRQAYFASSTLEWTTTHGEKEKELPLPS